MAYGTLPAAGLSLSAAAAWGGGDFFGGVATRRASVFRVVAIAHGCGLVAMLALAGLTGEALPPLVDLLWGAGAGIVGAFGIAALYQALAIGRMGMIAPVTSVVTGVLPVLVGIRSEGWPDRIQLLGFGLALISVWLVARPEGRVDTTRGMGLALVAGVMFGLFLVAGKQAGHHGVFWPLVIARAVSTGMMLVLVFVSPRDPRPIGGALWVILGSGVLDSVGNALFIAASRHGRLDVAAVLSSLYPASTVLLARFLLKERIAPLQSVGIVGALISVALIAAQ